MHGRFAHSLPVRHQRTDPARPVLRYPAHTTPLHCPEENEAFPAAASGQPGPDEHPTTNLSPRVGAAGILPAAGRVSGHEQRTPQALFLSIARGRPASSYSRAACQAAGAGASCRPAMPLESGQVTATHLPLPRIRLVTRCCTAPSLLFQSSARRPERELPSPRGRGRTDISAHPCASLLWVTRSGSRFSSRRTSSRTCLPVRRARQFLSSELQVLDLRDQ